MAGAWQDENHYYKYVTFSFLLRTFDLFMGYFVPVRILTPTNNMKQDYLTVSDRKLAITLLNVPKSLQMSRKLSMFLVGCGWVVTEILAIH